MAQILECTFNYSNSDNTGVWTRTGPAKTYPSAGILYRRNCPDGLHYYCDPTTGQNSYYRLLNPERYAGINASGPVYVYVGAEHLSGWRIISDSSSGSSQPSTNIPSYSGSSGSSSSSSVQSGGIFNTQTF